MQDSEPPGPEAAPSWAAIAFGLAALVAVFAESPVSSVVWDLGVAAYAQAAAAWTALALSFDSVASFAAFIALSWGFGLAADAEVAGRKFPISLGCVTIVAITSGTSGVPPRLMAVKDLRGISFPFRRGRNGFPEPNAGSRTVVDRVKSLLLTARGELPMGNEVGTNLQSFVFETLNPVLQARVSQDLRDTIRANEPLFQVISIEFSEKAIKGKGILIIASVVYEIAGEEGSMDVPVGFSGG